MIEMILGSYGVLCWLLFKKFKLIPVTTYTVCTAILGGIALLTGLYILVTMFHPASKDGRLYVYTTPIVSQVRGIVTEVTTEGKRLKQGDVLFKIDPQPYQYDVDRLEGALRDAEVQHERLGEQLKVAQSNVEAARSDVKTAESDFEKQSQEALQQARTSVAEARSKLELTSLEFQRAQELMKKQVIPQAEYDRIRAQYDVSTQSLKERESAERQAVEKLTSANDRIQSVREQLTRAEAEEREKRLAYEAQSGGMSPLVRQTKAELENKQWELAQTVVRAPADGEVIQVLLRPGQMATALGISPLMVFGQSDDPILVASFPQNVVPHLKRGLEAEIAFKSYPGKIFKAKVDGVQSAVSEGQLSASGQIQGTTVATAPGRIPVKLAYGEDVKALNLPGGSQATIAIYTEHAHALSIVRKILLRIKSWENYIFAA